MDLPIFRLPFAVMVKIAPPALVIPVFPDVSLGSFNSFSSFMEVGEHPLSKIARVVVALGADPFPGFLAA